MSDILKARFRIVTPMFIGDADREPLTGIRPPTIKGVLRFWWRALNWARFFQLSSGDAAEALRKLHEEESRLFGNAAQKVNGQQTGGQGQFLMEVKSRNLRRTEKNTVHSQFANCDAARYLGYGLMAAFDLNNENIKAGQLMRGCINENQSFDVWLRFRGAFDQSIHNALIALGLLGGMGSRSRHGMGSVCLESLSVNDHLVWDAPANRDSYIDAVRELLTGTPAAVGEPPYTAFSDLTQVDWLLKETNPYSVLDKFGRSEMMYRSWGKYGKVLRQRSEKRFDLDHHWSKGKGYSGYPTDPDFHPRRVVFGLPHNYGKEPHLQVQPMNYERRASPLLFHVHKLNGESFVGISILLPATFLPAKEKISAGGKHVPAKIEWRVLQGFLDGNKPDGTPRFPGKKPIIQAAR